MTRADKPHPGCQICTQDKHQFKQNRQYDTQLQALRAPYSIRDTH